MGFLVFIVTSDYPWMPCAAFDGVLDCIDYGIVVLGTGVIAF